MTKQWIKYEGRRCETLIWGRFYERDRSTFMWPWDTQNLMHGRFCWMRWCNCARTRSQRRQSVTWRSTKSSTKAFGAASEVVSINVAEALLYHHGTPENFRLWKFFVLVIVHLAPWHGKLDTEEDIKRYADAIVLAVGLSERYRLPERHTETSAVVSEVACVLT